MRRLRLRDLSPAVLLAIASPACTGPMDCTQVEPVAVEIAAVDRATGASVADSVTGTLAVSGATVALGPRQLDPGGAPVTLAGGTGPGTYAIYLKHPRFLDWDSTGVIVAKGRGCQPFTPVTLTARLTRR